jgi:hypothetical protein
MQNEIQALSYMIKNDSAAETRRSPKKVIGRILISVGLILPIAFALWYFHIRWNLVDKSVQLMPGHVEVEFTPNFEGHYVSGIKVQRKLPFETLQCLLGEKNYIPPSQCTNIPSVLQFKWRLNTDGRVAQEGTSENPLLGGSYGNDFIEMEFLYFQAKRGQHYNLDVEFTKNGSKLAATNPRLDVAVDSWDNSDTAMGFLWAVLFGAICILPGVALLARQTTRNNRRRNETVSTPQ